MTNQDTSNTDYRAKLFTIIEPAIFNHGDKHYLDRALDDLEDLLDQFADAVIGNLRKPQDYDGSVDTAVQNEWVHRINNFIAEQRQTKDRLLGKENK